VQVLISPVCGCPRIPARDAETVRDAIATYIKEKRSQANIVGHSLGGSWSAIGSKYPDLPGKLISVDGYPFLAGITILRRRRQGQLDGDEIEVQGRAVTADYEAVHEIGAWGSRHVTKDSDSTDHRVGPRVRSHRRHDTLYEMFKTTSAATWLRSSAVLMMAAWSDTNSTQITRRRRPMSATVRQAGGRRDTDHRHGAALHHVDDPDWMFTQMDGFLSHAR